MKFMILAAAMLAVSPAVASAQSDPAAEFGQLQTKAQAFVNTITLQTGIQDVETALGTNEGTVDQPCGSACSRVFEVQGGKAAPFDAMLLQYSTKLNNSNYHFDRPFVPEEVLFELDVPTATSHDLCFSQAAWNTALTQAGWEPLKPFDETLKVKVTDDKGAFDRNDDSTATVTNVPVHGFATRRGDRYLLLMPVAGAYWNAGLALASDVQTAEAMSTCLRTVVTDRHMAKRGYDAATAPKPAA